MNNFEFNEEKILVEEKLAIVVFTISFIAFNSIIAIPISLIFFAIFSYIKSKWK